MNNVFEDEQSMREIALMRRSFLFDADWYLRTYPQVAASGRDPVAHYYGEGWKLGYDPGPNFDRAALAPGSDQCPLVVALKTLSLRHPSFDKQSEGARNPDFVPCPEPAFERPGRFNSVHVGPAHVVHPASLTTPCAFDGTVAVHLHLFHMDMALDFRRLLDSLPVPFDLFVSVPNVGDVIAAEAEFGALEHVKRIVAVTFQNVGRDLGPMIAGFAQRLAPYDLVLHMHSKKSDHTPGKQDWAAQMGHHLLGSRGHATSVLEMFSRDPDLGLVFPVYHPSIRNQIRWGANFETCEQLMARMGAPLEDGDLTPFPAGSFFAIRGDVLRPLLAGEITFDDFDSEAGQIDGTMAHGIERMFSLMCRHLGYGQKQIRAARPYALSSMVLDDEPYTSTKLNKFRNAYAPSLPKVSTPLSLRLSIFSGGPKGQPLPYEHFFSQTRYVYFQDGPVEGAARCGHWELQQIPEVIGGDWIAAAAQAQDTDIAVWVAPNISLVDDISEHIYTLLLAKAAVGAFRHPYKQSIQAEIKRLDERHPQLDVSNTFAPLVPSKPHPLSDVDFIVFDMRHPGTADLLNAWGQTSRALHDLSVGQELAFDIACAGAGVDTVQLSANGVGLRADPRVRLFAWDDAPHLYNDIMPSLSQFAYEGRVTPSELRKQVLATTFDVVLLVTSTDRPDHIARSLQRLRSLADPRCRIIIYLTEGISDAAQAVLDSYLSDSPRSIITSDPATCLLGEMTAILSAGVVVTTGWVDELVAAVLSEPDITVFSPLILAGRDEADGIWTHKLADECRDAAYKSAGSLTLTSTLCAPPVVVRRGLATDLLAGACAAFSEALKNTVCRVVPSALVLVPSDYSLTGFPAEGTEFLDQRLAGHSTVSPTISPVAFYLPQFHTFTVNDVLWGAGFSEWRNVVKARPRFPGHHQPRLPGDLGYYDLCKAETLRTQGSLAELHGIFGMACYYYRFGEQRLMEGPTDLLLSDGSITLRFFYCWANEDWTRAWDGRSDDVNLKQDYSPQTISLILDDLIKACSDTRYIRVDGKPVFMIYQLNKLPNLQETLALFRNGLRERLGVEVCIGTTYNDAFEPEWEELIDFVAQFPPHRTPRRSPRNLLRGENAPKVSDPSREDFMESYSSVRSQSLDAVDMLSKLQPGLCPDWDNAARREHRAHTLVGASPVEFGKWARSAALATEGKLQTGATTTPFMFINAWNEWAEGAVMEPYEGDGRAILAELSRNLQWKA